MRTRSRIVPIALVALMVSQLGAAAASTDSSVVGTTAAQTAPSAVVATGVAVPTKDRARLAGLAVSETSRYVVEFDARANLVAASEVDGFTARGEAVVTALQQTADSSQSQALALVAARGGVAEAFWFRNLLIVDGSAALAAELAALPGVSEVRPERIYPLVRPVDRSEAMLAAAGDPEWGVAKVNADQVWAEGILGGGVVIANIDTGVDYTHPALVNQYRGNLGNGDFSHDYNWFDPTGICGGTPCDNAEHGTHTMGTMVGGDGPGPFTPDIGVAPGARWIAAKGCEDFGCSEGALLAAGQWVIAPTDVNGENPDPSMRPDIVNNSWGSGPGDEFYLETVQAWRAAGIIPVFSSGNPGPFCGEAGSPGDYLEAFSLGATDIDDVIADFSGRGPSVFGKTNPDASAPGVDVTSSVPGGGYAAFSGTSMAAPHAAGALALVLSAAPELLGDFDGATASLRSTAVDIIDLTCGGDDDGDPNNTYGEGRIDALAAVDLVATGGTLLGSVSDAASSDAIAGAIVTASNGERDFHTVSGPDGTFKLFLAEGEYVVTAAAFGYESNVLPGVSIVVDQTTQIVLELTALPTAVLTGVVLRSENNRPIAGANVRAIGVPVPAVTTDATGGYTMTLPVGRYSIEASQGGCLSRSTLDVNLIKDRRRNFRLVQLIDEFGHGCAPLAFEWVDAKLPTTLYGDDQTGRLPLPFSFPFYGDTYEDVFIATNGYLAFQDSFFGYSDFFNTPIPTQVEPNAAIYALWQDLWVIGDARVEYGLIEDASLGREGIVIEYSNVPVLGAEEGASFEVKLWDNGDIDLLYGAGMENVLSGRNATAGIENAFGTDGLQLAFQEAVLTEGAAWRISVVPTGVLRGRVRNANDGLPVAGATVTALPTGRTATTGPRGFYSMRLVPGRYLAGIAADNYEPAVRSVRIREDAVRRFRASLKAARAEVTPDVITVGTLSGEPVTSVVTIANTGTSSLTWDVRERDEGGVPPVLPPAAIRVLRRAEWKPIAVPDGFGPSYVLEPTFTGDVEEIISDPVGDAVGSVDITSVGGGASDTEISISVDFTDGTPMNQAVGLVFLDTDQTSTTGLPPEALFGLPTQDIGMEYFIDLFAAPEGLGYVVDANSFELVAEIAVETIGQSYRFDIPIEAIGNDDGSIDVDTAFGDFELVTDWAADVGHGTIEPFRDAPWMSQEPQSGSLLPGESTEVLVTLGGEGVEPGDYTGRIVFVTNDPRSAQHDVAVDLQVGLPENDGAVSGVVTNSRAGFPVPAVLTVTGERAGEEVVVAADADDTGFYRLFGPAGTWPLEVAFEGYQTFTGTVTITAAAEATLDISLEPLWPNGTLEGAPLSFSLAAGETADAELVLGNLAGLTDLEFEILELAGQAEPVAVPGRSNRRARNPQASSSSIAVAAPRPSQARFQDGATALVLQDVMPWGTDALQQVLTNNDVVFDAAGSDAMGTIDLAGYEAVFVSNDQTQEFYDTYTANAAWFESYVEAGGFLWFGGAAWGSNGGEADGLPLPGGVTLSGPVIEGSNEVVQIDHPVMTGVPGTFYGSEASHSAFLNTPEGSTIAIGTDSREPTLVEYGVGAGRVIAFGQPLEFAWTYGQDAAVILDNSVPYAMAFEPYTDIPWMSVDPVAGVVPVGGSQVLAVHVDTASLDPGTYLATVVIRTNDPLNRIARVAVTLIVT